MPIPKGLKKIGIDKVIGYVQKDPEKNLPKLVEWVEKFEGDSFRKHKKIVLDAILNEDNIYHGLLLRLLKSTEPEVMRTLLLNFFMYVHMTGADRRRVMCNKYCCNSPLVIMADVTTQVFSNREHNEGMQLVKSAMPFNTLDKLIRQGKDIGVFVYIFAGEEPLLRKDDIFRLCLKHSECIFLCFTDGHLIDSHVVAELLRVKNFVPFIKLDGDEEYVDKRCGNGSFAGAVRAMGMLKSAKLPFGILSCYKKDNLDIIMSEDYYDYMIATGATFVSFHYLDIGEKTESEHLLNMEECSRLRDRLREFRARKPLFALNLNNSTKNLEACLAAGEKYL